VAIEPTRNLRAILDAPAHSERLQQRCAVVVRQRRQRQ
jgi:hypothetical protein